MLEIQSVNANEKLWPYLLFLPQDPETRDEFIKSILASRLARNVFLSFDEEGKVFQRDLIQHLPHSNKSILKYLEKLGKYGLISTSTAVRGGKRVVYHELTTNGHGIASFYFKELPSDLGELTASLLENYLLRLVTLYRNQGMSETAIFDVFTRTRGLAILDGSIKYNNPDFMIFGASAFYTEIDCESIPKAGSSGSCKMPTRHPGGPSVDLALSLADDGHKTTFISVVGNDQDGYNVISDLVQHKVDVTHFKVDNSLRTNETLILNDYKGARILVGYGDTSVLTISSPKQVPWSILENSKVVYIGEVFVEVAISIVASAKQLDIPIIYRPSIPYLERGLESLEPIITQADYLILSNRALKYITTSKTASLKEILELSNGCVVARESRDNYLFVNKNGKPLTQPSRSEAPGITQWFVAGLLEGIAKGMDSYESFKKGLELEKEKLSS
jgi:sugar/nucleoside kinase (ribokinase family)